MAKGWILLIAATVTSLLFINYCDLIFRCGCTWLWAVADAHCNIHAPRGRHCPFCIKGYGFGVWTFMVLAQAGVVYARTSWTCRMRLLFAVLAFPIVGIIPALVLGLWTGYWN